MRGEKRAYYFLYVAGRRLKMALTNGSLKHFPSWEHLHIGAVTFPPFRLPHDQVMSWVCVCVSGPPSLSVPARSTRPLEEPGRKKLIPHLEGEPGLSSHNRKNTNGDRPLRFSGPAAIVASLEPRQTLVLHFQLAHSDLNKHACGQFE
jgi:hypothetical protein